MATQLCVCVCVCGGVGGWVGACICLSAQTLAEQPSGKYGQALIALGHSPERWACIYRERGGGMERKGRDRSVGSREVGIDTVHLHIRHCHTTTEEEFIVHLAQQCKGSTEKCRQQTSHPMTILFTHSHISGYQLRSCMPHTCMHM